jgi:hypothetical protein
MRKIMLFVAVVSIVSLSPAVFAQDKAAESPKDQASPSQPASGPRFDKLSPEEQAKLKEKWQNVAATDKTKAADKAREQVAGAAQDPQAPARREVFSAELTRLQTEYKTTIGELRAIKQLAVKENAKETADALTRLIAKHEAKYNQQMQALQQRMKVLQGGQAAKSGAQGQANTDKSPKQDGKGPKAEPKKEEAKPPTTPK